MLPFAVVGSEEEVEIDGEPVRARIYPWGLVEVDNPNHSDFVRLRGAILGCVIRSFCNTRVHVPVLLLARSHLNDLKSLTEDVLYETYRTEKLSRTVDSNTRDSVLLPQELANQGVKIKEEQLRREEEKVNILLCRELCTILISVQASGSGIASPERDQRKEARTDGEGAGPQVSLCSKYKLLSGTHFLRDTEIWSTELLKLTPLSEMVKVLVCHLLVWAILYRFLIRHLRPQFFLAFQVIEKGGSFSERPLMRLFLEYTRLSLVVVVVFLLHLCGLYVPYYKMLLYCRVLSIWI